MKSNIIKIEQIKQLREETGVSAIECKKALTEAKGDLKKAKEILKKWGSQLAGEKIKRETEEGIIESYIHPGKKIGAMIELDCESDFVARSEDFQKLAHELCLQIAAMDPKETSLMRQPWIRDETKTIRDLIQEYIAKLGENIIIKRFIRYEL
jgi:elongation factor Ts